MDQKNKRFLVTGSSGFFGKILESELKKAGEVTTLDFSGNPDIKADITSHVDDLPYFDMVIHAAGKAHMVPRTEDESQRFFAVNFQGTVHLARALEKNPPKSFIFISTVAVYGIDEGEGITEDSVLKGETPYAQSKIMAEEFILEWGKRNSCDVIILRLPLVAGPDAPGNLGAMIRGIKKGYYFRIGDGSAKRSLVLAKDVARFIPSLENKSGIYHLTDGYHPTFREIEEAILSHTGKKKIISIPGKIAKLAAKTGDILPFFPLNSLRLGKITGTLTFSDEKARRELGWKSEKVIQHLFD